MPHDGEGAVVGAERRRVQLPHHRAHAPARGRRVVRPRGGGVQTVAGGGEGHKGGTPLAPRRPPHGPSPIQGGHGGQPASPLGAHTPPRKGVGTAGGGTAVSGAGHGGGPAASMEPDGGRAVANAARRCLGNRCSARGPPRTPLGGPHRPRPMRAQRPASGTETAGRAGRAAGRQPAVPPTPSRPSPFLGEKRHRSSVSRRSFIKTYINIFPFLDQRARRHRHL